MRMKAYRLAIASLGVLALIYSVGAPVFQPMADCSSVRTAFDDGRTYVDFQKMRLRISEGETTEVALRGVSAFDSNQDLFRSIGTGQSISIVAHDAGEKKPALELFVKNVDPIEFVAVYHRPNSALVVSRFGADSAIRCEKSSNTSASGYVADLSRAENALSGSLTITPREQVYEQLGLS